MNGRPTLRGQGYQRKGGAAATRAHNAAVRAAAVPPPVAVAAESAVRPAADTGWTDGRASDRPVSLWATWTANAYATFAAVVGSSVATSAVWALVLR